MTTIRLSEWLKVTSTWAFVQLQVWFVCLAVNNKEKCIVWFPQATWWTGTCCRSCWRCSDSAGRCRAPAPPTSPPQSRHQTTADGAPAPAWPCSSAPAPTGTHKCFLGVGRTWIIMEVILEMQMSKQAPFHLSSHLRQPLITIKLLPAVVKNKENCSQAKLQQITTPTIF